MRKPKASLIAALSLALSMVLVVASPVLGKAKAIRFIRDAEVENIIRAYATPLFHAAGLNPKSIDL